jgi:hypothetical protein
MCPKQEPVLVSLMLELLALIEQKGCTTFLFTFSAANLHWPDLQRLLQNDEGATGSYLSEHRL